MTQGIETQGIEHRAERPFLSDHTATKLKTLGADYIGFVNLILFFVLIWPIAMLAYRIDRIFKTRLLDAIVRFCEAF